MEGGKPGGKLLLVDFGGIQQGSKDVADSEVMDTGTLVGTYGYMAPEQLRGSARPASDLFALGGTLLYLLSGSFNSHCHHLLCMQREFGCSACKVHASPCTAATRHPPHTQLCLLHLLLVRLADCLRLNIQSFVESMVNVGVASVL